MRTLGLVVLLVTAACSKKEDAAKQATPKTEPPKAEAPKDPPAAAPTAPTPAAPAAPDTAAGGTVSFDLNGAPAVTAPVKGDGEKNTGTASSKSNKLSLHLAGRAADWTKRGWLMVSTKAFTFKPGKLTDAKATFTWYRGKDNGGDAIYNGPLDVELTSFEEIETNPVGKKFKASGTFSGELKLMTGFKADIAVMKFTNGKFEGVEVQEFAAK